MTDITTKDLITDAEDTSGVFDLLMESVEIALNKQFTENKIVGTDYAEVYLGSIQSAMSQAITYVLGVNIANKQADLLTQQLATEVQNTLKVTEDIIVSTNQGNLLLKQIDKLISEIALIDNKTLTEIKQTLKVIEETDLTTAQEGLIVKQALTEIKQELLVAASVTKTNSETTYTNNKAATELKIALKAIQDTALSAAQTLKVSAEDALIDQKLVTEIQQTLKVTAEKTLLNQKTDTEKAQILDTINAAAVVGLVGKQKSLYTAQTDGFARDAEQKLLKIMMDGWSVARSTSTDGSVIQPVEGNTTAISASLDIAKTNTGI